MLFDAVMLSAAEREDLRQLLEEREGIPIVLHEGIRELWYRSEDGHSELRLLFLADFKVTVSRVEFVRRRQGTMTKVAEFLEDFCRRNGIEWLVVQSASTEEIVSWCQKAGFEPNQDATIFMNGIAVGDYRKQMASRRSDSNGAERPDCDNY